MNETEAVTTLLYWSSPFLVASAIGALAMWAYRWKKQLLAIDTWKEVGALAAFVSPVVIAKLGEPETSWQAIATAAALAVMAAVKTNSAAVPTPKKPPGSIASMLFLFLFAASCGGGLNQQVLARAIESGTPDLCFAMGDDAEECLNTAEEVLLRRCLLEPTAVMALECAERVGMEFDIAIEAVDGDVER
jgi:hypothetical protein